ncbi:hypothetical protein VKT23_019938 [Stygiomarasmius scandens]|uniref:PD-(D/E)XK endonuclease-like domain-containing protein n=1 Tax=Marasmiellus scandens TaxID=2682957 RepID=A0ABR1IMY1_9AGAR
MDDWSMEVQANSIASSPTSGVFDLGFTATSTPPRHRRHSDAASSPAILTPQLQFSPSPPDLSQLVDWSTVKRPTNLPRSKRSLVAQLPLGDRPESVDIRFDSHGRAVDLGAPIAGRPDFVVTIKIGNEDVVIIIVEDKIRHMSLATNQVKRYMSDFDTHKRATLGMAFVMTKEGLLVSLLRRQNGTIQNMENEQGSVWFSPIDNFVHQQIVEVLREALKEQKNNLN